MGVGMRRHRAGVDRHQPAAAELVEPLPTQPASAATEAGSVRDSGSTGRPARACSASWTIRAMSTPDVRRQVGLVDDQQVGALDPRAALAGHVATTGHVEHEHLGVHQRGGERGGEVVAAGLDQDDVERREPLLEVLHGHQVGGDVVADRRVRAGAGLDPDDALLGQHAGRAEEPRVLVGVDVVGDDGRAAA